MKSVWIVDDDESIRWVLEKALSKAAIHCRCFDSANKTIEALHQKLPELIVCDVRMPGMDGFKFLAYIKETYPNLPVIIMTAFSDLDSAVNAFQAGAFEYLPKPFDINKAVDLIGRAIEQSQRDISSVQVQIQTAPILGQAPAMQEVFRAIGRLSQSQATVLITGESGTGKELVANALHRHSLRVNKPFVAINTASIPKDLLESELFGHERGAFTGAQALRRGRFEQAEEGSLFLDEIGDMPMDLQTRLLRVLSDGHFYRVGGHTPLKANVRVIAATHQNLEERVLAGKFREDLFHRLNVIRLRLPPLRQRTEDIPLLARYFLQKNANQLGVECKQLSTEAMQTLIKLPFPGNVRQLENLCHWFTVMAPSQVIEVKDFPGELMTQLPASHLELKEEEVESVLNSEETVASVNTSNTHLNKESQYSWLTLLDEQARLLLQKQTLDVMPKLSAEFERVLIQAALSITKGKRIEAAHRLGIGRNTITRKIEELKIATAMDK